MEVTALYEKKKVETAFKLINQIKPETDIVVPIAVGEPRTLVETLPEHQGLKGNRLFQMLSLGPVLDIEKERLQIVSMFLTGHERVAFQAGKIDLLPNHFSDVPHILEEILREPTIMIQTSKMNEEGYFSLGTNADYTMTVIENGAKIIAEVNEQMPFTDGENLIHLKDIEGFIETNRPLPTTPDIPLRPADKKIGRLCAHLIEDGSTIQIGFGSIPNAIMDDLHEHKELTVHTEMIPDKIVDLMESGAVTNQNNVFAPGCLTATFAYGSNRLYSFMNENPLIKMMPVKDTNDSRKLAAIPKLVTINAAIEVDLYGQCNAETVSGSYYSSTGGQADFGIGARMNKEAKGIICLHASAKGGAISKIVPKLSAGAVVTTSKNDVDYVVTEFGVAKLRGKTVHERAKALIAIAHPDFREQLEEDARSAALLPPK
ncbi:4-hydroxybutyrate coenzyme A transferase [Bacillus sp. JCM 19045]|nr:4-hydroxybutyrate coenzyme A transferase [Bacillus sp. JCM 19045]